MTALDRLYASGGSEIIHRTIEITDGTNTFRFTNGWRDIVAIIESGQTVTFTAIGMEIEEPPKNEDGSQDITFALSNIQGIVSNYIISNIISNTSMMLKFRIYTSDDLTAPARPFDEFEVKGGSFDALSVNITAGYFDILGTLWPRKVFDLIDFPGLRYLQ